MRRVPDFLIFQEQPEIWISFEISPHLKCWETNSKMFWILREPNNPHAAGLRPRPGHPLARAPAWEEAELPRHGQ